MNHPESCAPPPHVYYTTTSATPIVSNESRADKRVGGPTPISTDTVTSTVAQVEVTQAKGRRPASPEDCLLHVNDLRHRQQQRTRVRHASPYTDHMRPIKMKSLPCIYIHLEIGEVVKFQTCLFNDRQSDRG